MLVVFKARRVKELNVTLERVVPALHAVRRELSSLIRLPQFGFENGSDPAGDVVLDREGVCHFTVKPIRPHMTAGFPVDQLSVDPNLVTGLAMAGLATVVQAGSELDEALNTGAERLTSDEISERFIGKTATFVADKTGDKYLVYYGENNEFAGGKAGGDISNVGFQAVNDRDQLCLGWEGSDLPRLRCMDVLLIDGVVPSSGPMAA